MLSRSFRVHRSTEQALGSLSRLTMKAQRESFIVVQPQKRQIKPEVIDVKENNRTKYKGTFL
jgi:hypothetical protein